MSTVVKWNKQLGRVALVLALWVANAAPAAAHAGHSSPQPWDACASAELGNACEWETDDRDLYVGTCRTVSDRLLCVRNEAIVSAATRDHDHDHAAGVQQHAEDVRPPLGWVFGALALLSLFVVWRTRARTPAVAS